MPTEREWKQIQYDRFWELLGPALFSSPRRAAAVDEVTQLLALSGAPAGASVLDMPCGVGRHALELARRGFAVTGIDRTTSYLDQARGAAAAAGLAVELVEADMREFARPEAFDLGLNLFSSIGYFEDPGEDLRVLANFARSLRPDGALVLELGGKEILAREFRQRDWHEADGMLWLEERSLWPDGSAIDLRWILVDDGERDELELTVRLFSAVELRGMLVEAGFGAVEVYGNLEGGPYDETARRLVMIARK